jgi:hypothetical protein
MALRSLELIPYRSVLFLLTRFTIVLPVSIGPHPSSLRCLTVSGSSEQYEKGSMSELETELAILVRTVEKLLNMLAISVMFVVGVPLKRISVSFCVFC